MAVRIYKVKSAKVPSVRQALASDDWARNGYTLRAAKGMGFNIPEYFLYVNATDEFFNNHEKEVLIEGVTVVEGNEYDNVKKAFVAEEDNVANGIALFD